jgi:hypothetical protein
MPPKIPVDVKEDLTAMGLTVWNIAHPITFDYEWTGNGPKRGRADKSRVHVQLAGPGLDGYSPVGQGATARDAIAAAMRHPVLLKRQGGVLAALATLEEEMRMLAYAMLTLRCGSGADLDDDVPF